MMTSISIVREKETGTMEVLLVSPVKPLFIVLAKAVPYFVLSFCQSGHHSAAFCICTGCTGSGESVLVGDGVFALYFRVAGFGFADFLGNKYTGGGHAGLRNDFDDAHHGFVRYDFPVESMPVILSAISDIIPARWYIQAVRKLMIEGVPVVLVFKEIGILLLMATVLITISIRKFKYRLE